MSSSRAAGSVGQQLVGDRVEARRSARPAASASAARPTSIGRRRDSTSPSVNSHSVSPGASVKCPSVHRSGAAEAERRAARRVDVARAAGGHEQRRQVAGAGQLALAGRGVEHDVDDRDERDRARRGGDERVQVVDHLGRPGALERVGAQRVADLAHRRGRVHPAPADVADHDPEAAVGEPERVVPVAAGVVARVARRRSARRARSRAARAASAGSSARWSVSAVACSRANSRAWSSASPARRPSSSASSSSRVEYWRPDSAHTNVIAPSVRPRAASGTTITECICSSRTSWICSSSSAAASSSARVDHRVELRAAGADHRGRAGRRVGVGRVALLQLARPAHLLGVDVGDRDLLVAAAGRRAGPRTSRRAAGRRAARPPRASPPGPSTRRAPGWRRRGTRAPPRGGGAR